MIDSVKKPRLDSRLVTVAVVIAVLLAAAVLGARPSIWILVAILAIPALLILLQRPAVGLLFLVVAALVVPYNISTGTEVQLNLATLLVPALLAFWILKMVQDRDIRLVTSRVNLPLTLFLVSGLIALFLGNALWDPFVPRRSNFIMVQLAQWAIFAFSAFIFWLTPNLIKDQRWLKRLTMGFLALAGILAIVYVIPGIGLWLGKITTVALIRAPFWTLLAALAGGQLVFNKDLSNRWRVFLVITSLAVAVFAFVEQRESISNWAAVLVVFAALAWMRFPRARWPLLVVTILLILSGLLFPVLWEFAGGEDEWEISGGSRLALAGRVIELTMRNPITGLGPAAYRPYGLTGSLQYGGAYYQSIALSSHNNYVDLFSHGGILMLGLFGWFVFELSRIGLRLHRRFADDFRAGFVNGVLAAGLSSLVIMMLADWILPFVYNIGFPGFQASVLVWMFMGGLVALDNVSRLNPAPENVTETPSA